MIINYCKEGMAISDFEDIEKFILGTSNIQTSSQSVINMAVILFLEGKIKSLQVQFNGKDIPLQPDGMFEIWPKGFCDLNEILAGRLLRLQAKLVRGVNTSS